MPNTTNFNWVTPADTDLVKDGAAAIRTLGNGIDTSFLDLKGGTSGQVLAKNSNTDLDFTWVAQDDSNAIQNAIVDAKGDLISATAADTPARLAVGTNGHILTADSTTSTGLKWAAPSGGALTWSLLNSGGTALSGSAKTTISFSAQKQLLILYKDASSANASSFFNIRLNDDNAAAYTSGGTQGRIYDPINANLVFAPSFLEGLTEIRGARMSTSAGSLMYGSVKVENADSTSYKIFTAMGGGTRDSSDNPEVINQQGFYSGASAITSVSFNSSTGNFDGGTVYVYGGV